MPDWRIQAIPLGANFVIKDRLTVGLDSDLQLWFPYLSFFVSDGKTNILIDCGISENFIVDGKAWSGFPGKGGTEYALKEFAKAKVDPKNIDIVIYTHLHNDHTGCCHLFEGAIHIFQWDEWRELMDPLPSMRLRRDFDLEVIPVLQRMDCRRIDGDLELMKGIRLYKTPGHTAGSMCVGVETSKGTYYILGDTAHTYQNLFSQCSEVTTLEGKRIHITPAPEVYGPFVPSSLVYDHYSWYKSMYRLRALCPSMEFALPGHETSIAGKTFPE
jgi:N-acyl homoserine lactone hydrolase